jgi:hypothetical protein
MSDALTSKTSVDWRSLCLRLRDAVMEEGQSSMYGVGTKKARRELALVWREVDDAERLPVETSRDAEDAAKWRALRGSARITAIGAAGLGAHRRKPNHYAHLTLNFWTVHDAPADALALEWLDEYVEIAQRAQGAAEKTSVPPASCVHEWWTDSDGDHHCTKCGATNMQSLKASVPHAMQSHTMQCRSNYFDFQAKAPYPCNCALNGTVPHE